MTTVMDSSPFMPLHNTIDRRIFPANKKIGKEGNAVKNRENFEVNFARPGNYRKSAVPYCQRILNTHFQST